MWSERPLTGTSLPFGTLCLTFDDGPGASGLKPAGPQTLEIGHYLSGENIVATFFMVGRHVLEFPEVSDRLRALGHIVGNHGFSHLHLDRSSTSDQEMVAEVVKTRELIMSEDFRTAPIFFRPPYGGWTRRMANILNADAATCLDHIGPVGWEVCADDFAFWRDGRTAAACADAYESLVMRRKARNGILLCHDRTADDPAISQKNQTLAMIRLLVPRLRARGLRFAALGEIPAIAALSRALIRCTLQASNGKFVSVSESGRAAACAGIAGQREQISLRRTPGNSWQVENTEGAVVWSKVTPAPLPNGCLAFRNGNGTYVSWRRDGECEETSYLEAEAVMRFRFVGTR